MNAVLVVLVKPGSKASGIIVSGDTVTVRVREPAIEGRATESAMRAIAAALHVPKNAVALIRGATSRQKAFAITGLTKEEVFGRLR